MTEPTNHKEITALIKRISGQANFIGTPRLYVDIFAGDIVAAVWFNQVVYWDGKTAEPIGFHKTYAEWKKELGLSEYQVRRVAMMCQERGLVNILFRKVYGTPKLHYLVVWPELLKTLKATLEKPDPEETEGSETQGSEGEDSAGSKEGEETQGSLSIEEITTKRELNIDTYMNLPPDESVNQIIHGSRNAAGAWDAVLEQLKKDMLRGGFDTWVKLSRAFCYDFETDTLTIGAPGTDAVEWLEDRVKSTAERLLVGILARQVEIKFIVPPSPILELNNSSV